MKNLKEIIKEAEMKHQEIVRDLVIKYKADKNVIGIYIFGSMASGKFTPKSDIDIEIIFKKKMRSYELINKIINGIKVDLSLYDKKMFLSDFINKPYNQYAALNNKILYDPEKILINNLGCVKQYFKKNPEILKYWKTKDKEWKKTKKEGRKGSAENYFDIMKELEKRLR